MDTSIKCEKLLNELYKFSNEVLILGIPIKDNRLEIFEKKIGYILPDDFKYILKKHNKISLFGVELIGYDDEFQNSSLDKVYEFEHFEVSNKMPSQFVPFSPDGRGNHYCLDLSKYIDGFTPVVFWQWDCIYENFEDVEVCNSSFVDWMQEVMIEWSLEEFNYDGSEK
ncbi:hypothetical protein RT99_18010 [Flavobacterium sp. MEB061]|uniref:SMI1/KNR4 family protein n=1 Tax=Flavobacterium sp. MEB061 TaxID=1587524 RepID=UPI0005AC62FD|nr:SMI1/KNR4 family protein [Flavobacterium sp. MEB061]KIQ17957.1 hypothetical protein RT99_18010 [Flavobacterium sp. MEB061]